MRKSQCIVLIPIYQNELNEYEKKSIFNTIDKFDGIYDTYYLIGEHFDLNSFYKINNIKSEYQINYYMFEDFYFKDISSYNNLLLSNNFYETFKDQYKYILIVQTDAYIFNQFKIFDFINKDYKFIGAPVIWPDALVRFSMFKRGIYYNGGLSLRDINFCLDCLSNKEYLDKLSSYGYLDEDMIFSSFMQEFYSSPTYIEALNFSLDNQINCYAPVLDFKPPFGVHHFWNDDDNGNNKLQYIKNLKWI